MKLMQIQPAGGNVEIRYNAQLDDISGLSNVEVIGGRGEEGSQAVEDQDIVQVLYSTHWFLTGNSSICDCLSVSFIANGQG